MKASKSKSGSTRYALVLGLFVLGLVIFMVVRNLSAPLKTPGRIQPNGETVAGSINEGGASGATNENHVSSSAHKATRDQLRKARPRKEDGVSPVFALVEGILLDEKINDEQAALRFREIAQSAEVSELERLEALTHGLNLNFAAFEGFAKDATLPVPLAQKYFDELANASPSETFQISAWLDLLGNADANINSQAAGQLATALDDESLAADPLTLRRVAAKHLEMLKSTPQVP